MLLLYGVPHALGYIVGYFMLMDSTLCDSGERRVMTSPVLYVEETGGNARVVQFTYYTRFQPDEYMAALRVTAAHTREGLLTERLLSVEPSGGGDEPVIESHGSLIRLQPRKAGVNGWR